MNAKKHATTLLEWATKIVAKFGKQILTAIMGVMVVGLVTYIFTWAAMPSNVKELKIASEKNIQEHTQIFRCVDSLEVKKLDKSDYKEDIRKVDQKFDKLDEKITKIYEILIEK